MSAVVIYVHGLWQRGAESAWLRRRVGEDLKVDTRTFSYPSVGSNVTDNARALAGFLADLPVDSLHLIGHSLGGLVILKLFEQGYAAWLPPGRVVLLGPPLRGSRTAQNLARLPFGKRILGRGIDEDALVARDRLWDRSRDLGVIAGDLGVGLGRLVGKLDGPSDGTVLVEETRLAGANDHAVLRVSHTGMLFSAKVAKQAAIFLRTGRFGP